MEIVIKIPEDEYKRVMNGKWTGNPLADYIEYGTPLPKGHGDLIDRDGLELDCYWSDYYDGFSAYSESQVRLAPTIIEAEESDSE